MCPLCGLAEDTDFHRVWDPCPAIAGAMRDDVMDTDGLVCQAKAMAASVPCLWLRAINQFNDAKIPEPDDDMHVWNFGEAHDMYNVEGLTVYLDESGGE